MNSITKNEKGKSWLRKPRIYQEEAKTRQTSHWDWDYLPVATLERLARDASADPPDGPRPLAALGRHKVGLICVAAGILTIVGLLALLVLV